MKGARTELVEKRGVIILQNDAKYIFELRFISIKNRKYSCIDRILKRILREKIVLTYRWAII